MCLLCVSSVPDGNDTDNSEVSALRELSYIQESKRQFAEKQKILHTVKSATKKTKGSNIMGQDTYFGKNKSSKYFQYYSWKDQICIIWQMPMQSNTNLNTLLIAKIQIVVMPTEHLKINKHKELNTTSIH